MELLSTAFLRLSAGEHRGQLARGVEHRRSQRRCEATEELFVAEASLKGEWMRIKKWLI